jgi:hypothetical protein
MILPNASVREVHIKGLKALARELGPDGFIRFIQYYRKGKGDYTKGRAALLKSISFDDITAALARRRKHRR